MARATARTTINAERVTRPRWCRIAKHEWRSSQPVRGPGTSQYFGGLLLGSALSAAWLRRHSIVWKVSALRYILGASELLFIDLALPRRAWGRSPLHRRSYLALVNIACAERERECRDLSGCWRTRVTSIIKINRRVWGQHNGSGFSGHYYLLSGFAASDLPPPSG